MTQRSPSCPGCSTTRSRAAAAWYVGEVSGLFPPGDIHKVENAGGGLAVSLHGYGADLRSTGSSIRRTYDLPVG